MRGETEDSAPFLPDPPEAIPPLTADASGLALAGAAGARRLLVEGEATTLTGSERGPIDAVWIDGHRVASDVRWDGGAVANVLLHPGLARRERVGARGVAAETILAAPTLPLAAFQLSAGAEAPAHLGLAVHLEGSQVQVRRSRGSVVLGGDTGHLVAVAVSPPDARLRLHEGADLRVEVESDRSGTLTVLLASGSAERVRATISAVPHLSTHARRAAEAPSDDGLVVTSGVEEIDDGVRWARARLAAALARARSAHPSRAAPSALWAAVAALGVGDRRSAERAIALVREHGGTPPTFDPSAAAELVVRRAALTFGGAEEAPTAGRRSKGAEGRPRAPGGASGDARGIGLATRGQHVRLPVVGESRGGEAQIGWLGSLLEGEPTTGPPPPSSAEEMSVRLPGLFRADPDAAWARWRRTIAEGLAGGPDGRATWDAMEGPGDVLHPRTSALLSSLAHGLLGLAPDAPAGRIRLAPRFPTHLTRFGVSGITVGSARLALRYERDGPIRRYVLEPERAHVPPMAVLEPAVDGRAREVRIDGAVADLETRPAAGRTVVPVQLPVDGVRVVEIDCS